MQTKVIFTRKALQLASLRNEVQSNSEMDYWQMNDSNVCNMHI